MGKIDNEWLTRLLLVARLRKSLPVGTYINDDVATQRTAPPARRLPIAGCGAAPPR